jgi:hypothetical protein
MEADLMAKGYCNIEPVARAICVRELATFPEVKSEDIPALVDRYWQVIAAELSAGLRDDAGQVVPHSVAAGLVAWETWLDHRRGIDEASAADAGPDDEKIPIGLRTSDRGHL